MPGALDTVLSSPVAAHLNKAVGPVGDMLNSARTMNWDPFGLKQAVPAAAAGLDNIAGGPAQNVLQQYDSNQSLEVPKPAPAGVDYAQRLAAQAGDSPTYASAAGMKGAGFSGVKRAK
jgi:hypothetical protein